MATATELLQAFLAEKQRPRSMPDFWGDFLYYLEQRNGADLRGFNKAEEIHAAMDYLEAHEEDWNSRSNDPATGWFEEFSRRDDVVEACGRFLKQL